jgi:crotonobetainyl-CoA:carnitine CoA-transferase CaiB-like acyl-CoA transferase
MAPKFLHLNRNKRSVCLDLKNPVAYDVLVEMIKSCDVMTWNVRPDSMARLKLSYDEVKAINPRIIYCGMFGFGQEGRYAQIPAYDQIIQGSSGIAAINAKAFGVPRYLPYVVADRTSGLIAVQMIAMALYHREKTGLGQSIEVPMFENMVTQVLTEHLYNQTYVPPIGEAGDPRLLNEFYAPSKTLDGYICISANTDAQVFPLFEAMGLGHLKDDERFSSVAARFKNVREYYGLRSRELAKQSTAFWLEFCAEHDIPAAPYHTLESLVEDPHLRDVGMLVERDHPSEGKILDLKPANKLSSGHREDWRPAPLLGEHTADILKEFGVSQERIDAMLKDGIALSANKRPND